MQLMQVEAVIKMLAPDFDVGRIAPKRRNKNNPWFKRGTLFRSALDVLRTAERPLSAREIAAAMLDGKTPMASRKQEVDLQGAVLAAMRQRAGKAVENVRGDGMGPLRWRLTQNQ